ncbi:Phage capsid family protein [compost metagenome]
MSIEIITKAIEDHGEAVKTMKEESDNKIGWIDKRLTALERVKREAAGASYKAGVSGDVGAVLRAFTESEQFGGFKRGMPSTGQVQLGNISIKALTNQGAGVAGSTGYNVQAERMDGLFNDPRRRLSLLNILPFLVVSTGTFEYLKLSGYTNSAAFQLEEGAEKAQGNVPTVVEQSQIATVAHWCQASVQVLDDAPALAQQVGSLMEYGLLAKLEAEIVSGTAGQGKIKGLVDHAIDFVVTGTPTPADAIGQAATSMEADGWSPGLILLNPADWFGIASARDTAGQYVLGSPRDPSPAGLWNVPVVTTPSLAKGTALVIDPAQVAVLDRMSPTLLASREANGGFTKNMVTILAELRAGLAVFAEGAVLAVNIAATP